MMKKQNTASAKSKRFITNTIVHVILAVLAVIWVIPIAWIIMISFRGESGQYISTLIPKTFTLNNYKKLFTDTQILNFPQMFIYTLIISIFSCVISTFFVLSVSYCMSRMRFKMRKPMMNIALVLGMFPGFMSMIAVYYILKSVGLSEGAMIRVALVLVYSGGAGLGFYIAKGFFDTIPKSIDISAVSVTSSGALEGLGMGIPSLMISLCRFIAIILPLAFFLCKLTGPTGVWNAFWITEVVTALISVFIYRFSVSRQKDLK